MSNDSSNRIPAKNSSSSRPRILRVHAESCFIGNKELSMSTAEEYSVNACGEVLLLEQISGVKEARNATSDPQSDGITKEEGKILMTEFSLDTNIALQLDYSCLLDGTFKAIIAPFFGMQILSLASKCGVLLVPLPAQTIEDLRERLIKIDDSSLNIDLAGQTIETSDSTQFEFQTAPWHRDRLLNGRDDMDEVLALNEARKEYLESDRKRRPWLYS